jgi:hypothetical protein
MNLKHPIVVLIVAALLIAGLYYWMSPYQNCVRNKAGRYDVSMDLRPGAKKHVQNLCFQMTNW